MLSGNIFAERILMDDPRKVEIEIVRNQGKLDMEVSFISTRLFSHSKNKNINANLARRFAIKGLSKFLNADCKIEIKGLSCVYEKEVDRRHVAKYTVLDSWVKKIENDAGTSTVNSILPKASSDSMTFSEDELNGMSLLNYATAMKSNLVWVWKEKALSISAAKDDDELSEIEEDFSTELGAEQLRPNLEADAMLMSDDIVEILAVAENGVRDLSSRVMLRMKELELYNGLSPDVSKTTREIDIAKKQLIDLAEECLSGHSLSKVPKQDYFSGCRDLKMDKSEFRLPLNALGEICLSSGGGAILELDGAKYILSVGITDCRSEYSAKEQLRRLTVSRSKAVKELIRLFEKTNVSAREETKSETTLSRSDNGKEIMVNTETMFEEYKEAISAFIITPEVLATWISADGAFFFTAIGKKL